MSLTLSICILSSIGCSTIPVTSGTQAIDSMLTDGSLDPLKTDTPSQVAQKERVKKTLTQARADIVQESSERIAAENEEKKDASLAGVGRFAWGLLIIFGIGLIAFVIINIIRRGGGNC